MSTHGRYCFISYDLRDALAHRWAFRIAEYLGEAGTPLRVVVPQWSWTLGHWTQYLEDAVAGAERSIVVLSPGFVTTPSFVTPADTFVQLQRRLLLQEPVRSEQGDAPRPRLLVVLVADCQSLLSRTEIREEVPLLYTDRVRWVDLGSAGSAEETCRQSLIEGFAAA